MKSTETRPAEDPAPAYRIEVGRMHYRDLNRLIREKAGEGVRRFILAGVVGQRYIGAGLEPQISIEIDGVPGQDLGVFMGGARIEVHGNAQDGVGNTMNDGTVIIHGSVGDIPGHMARNGRIFVKGSAGFRAGIMMKEYGNRHPLLIIGESAGDYLGEYMAGGELIVLGYGLQAATIGGEATDRLAEGGGAAFCTGGPVHSPVGAHVGTGMFGGTIWVRGAVAAHQLGRGAVLAAAGPDDLEAIRPALEEFAATFDLSLERILSAPFQVIRRAGERPYGDLYVHGSKTIRNLKPLHRNLRAPCAAACPVGIPNPVIIRALKEGRVSEAFDLVDDYTPFRYSCCGLICPGLCRAACSRNGLDSAVRIDEIARAYAPNGEVKRIGQVADGTAGQNAAKPHSAKQSAAKPPIAVIGAGPAGLSAAWHLARLGYPVEVFDRETDIGGKLTHSIPDSRLPREEVERDLARIRSLGIRFHTGAAVGAEEFRRLREEFKAVVVASGAQRPRRLGFPGEGEAVSSFEFLRAVKASRFPQSLAGKQVLILGAGNVAMDAACECFRLGAAAVTAVDVRKPAAFGEEVDRALELGTRILFPRFLESYESGTARFRDGSSLRTDLLIEAVGEVPELSFAGTDLVIDPVTFTTNLPFLFAVGDAVRPGLVTHSIGMGRAAARSIDRTLRGADPAAGEEEAPAVEAARINLVYFPQRNGLSACLEDCFSCGTCIQCDLCVEGCPRGAIRRTGESFTVNEEVCSGCGVCASVCPRAAIAMVPRRARPPSAALQIARQCDSILAAGGIR